jgi:hypothetical protein
MHYTKRHKCDNRAAITDISKWSGELSIQIKAAAATGGERAQTFSVHA